MGFVSLQVVGPGRLYRGMVGVAADLCMHVLVGALASALQVCPPVPGRLGQRSERLVTHGGTRGKGHILRKLSRVHLVIKRPLCLLCSLSPRIMECSFIGFKFLGYTC